SEDDGKTWSRRLLLDERGGVSYPDAVIAPDGLISVLYDYGRTTEKEIVLAQFREADVLAQSLVSSDARLRCIISKAP
nr:sialidase family protein [Clostridia bacterium]